MKKLLGLGNSAAARTMAVGNILTLDNDFQDFTPATFPTTIGYTPSVISATPTLIPVSTPLFTPTTSLPSTFIDKVVRIVDEYGKAMPDAIAFQDGAKSGVVADANGNITLRKVEAMSEIRISHQGFISQYFKAASLPSTVILKMGATDLEGLTITPKTTPTAKKSNFWLYLLVGGTFVYAGYRYTHNRKTNRVVKTKI